MNGRTYNNTGGLDDSTDVSAAPSAEGMSLLVKAEIDQAIATAHAYPRNLRSFLEEGKALVTFSDDMAQACMYALPRKDENGKRIHITGPSARFAEVILSCYGNCTSGGRVVGEDGQFIVSQGVFHDLEKNNRIVMETRRRIAGKAGKKFSSDMIGVTGNAAAAIAHRNAVLKGIPKALWLPLYEAAVAVATGSSKPMSERRARALAVLAKMGAPADMVLAELGISSEVEITEAHLETMFGWATAIKEGSGSVDSIFKDEPEPGSAPGATGGDGGIAGVAEALASRGSKKASADQPAPKEIIGWLTSAATVAELNAVWSTWADAMPDYLPDDAMPIVAAYETRRGELEA